MPMVSLARPGITARMDCGRMMRRNVSNGPMPSAAAAVDCERFTDKIPTKQFSAERRFVQCKADNRGRDFIETQTDQRQRVEDEHELQQLRRAAHEPDITPRR